MNLTPMATEELAHKILLHSRRRISHIAPVLLEAIYALPEKAFPLPAPLFTDGCTLWYHPEQVVEDFRKDRDAVARQLLHVTCHCLLGHLDLRADFEKVSAFDGAADLKAAQLAEGLCGTVFSVNDGGSGSGNYFDMQTHLRPLYQELADGSCHIPFLKEKLRDSRFDNHALWTPPAELTAAARGGGASSDDSGGSSQSSDDPAGSGNPAPPNWDSIRQSMLNGKGGKLPGNCAGMMTDQFSTEERGMSFADFLKRFASPQERLLLDPDTFDMRWYHLGLEYYGNIPLLEPSELSEPPAPDNIVVALDVSGSCCGETCKRFLKELLGILRDISAGAPRFRVLLLTCDTAIQKEILLETPDQVEELFAQFSLSGWGGTDFRPVFDRIAQLREEGALPQVRGLLYLTDGCGDYPDTPADYPTVFMIPAEERPYHQYWNAAWITYLFLNDNDFTLEEAAV